MPRLTGYARDPKASDKKAIETATQLLTAGKDHRTSARESIWRNVDKQYGGKHWDLVAVEDPTADLTSVNMSFGTIQTIKPYITGRQPRFHLEPFSANATRTSAILQEVFLNRLWRHPPVGAQEGLRAATFDYLKYGDGFMKGTYQIVPKTGQDGEPTNAAELHVDRVSPWDMWIDPYSDGIPNARWVAHRIWMTEGEARRDERFTIPKSYEFTDRRVEDDDRSNRTNVGLPDAQRWVQVIEFYDVVEQIMYAFPVNASEEGSTITNASDLPWQVVEEMQLPIVQLPNYDLGDSPWHIGDLEQITDLQDELNKTRSEQMTHRRRNVAKTFVRKGVLDEAAQQALQSPIVNEFVEIDTQEPLQNVVVPYQQAPLTSDIYGSSAEIKDDIREITGITEYQRGVAPEITRTATEASIMDASANVKLEAKLTAVEEACRRLGVILLGIAREVFPDTDPDEWAMFIGGEEAQRLARSAQADQVSGKMEAGDLMGAVETSNQILPDTVNASPTADMFKGEYEVLVEVGSTEYRDPKLKEERLREMFFQLTEAAPMLMQMGVQLDMAHLARLWLESTDIIDVDSILGQGTQLPMGPQMGAGQPVNGQPAPEQAQTVANTGLLETGQIAPATPATPTAGVPY